MNELFNIGGTLAGVAGAIALIASSIRTNAARIWKEEAEAQKTKNNRLIGELEEIKTRLTLLEKYNATLVALVTTIDPQKLEELRSRGGFNV